MISIVLGYNIFTKRNRMYKHYLDRSLNWILDKDSDRVLISGGYSNTHYPNISEARSIQDYFLEHAPALKDKLFLEERSLTTLQNIAFSTELVSQWNLTSPDIQIICDSIRAPKVFYLALMYLNDTLKLNTTEQSVFARLLQLQTLDVNIIEDVQVCYKALSVRGVSFKRDRKDIGRQILASMTEIGAYRFPEIENAYLDLRKDAFGLS